MISTSVLIVTRVTISSNLELARLSGGNFKNAVVREAYVVGATRVIPNDYGQKGADMNLENSDWTDTQFRKDQLMYLCGLPSAKGTNPTTGEDTRDSLRCFTVE